MKKWAAVCAVLLTSGAITARVAQAHHSAAMFDGNRVVVLRGTMLSVSYVNPHSWISLVVPAGSNVPEGRWDVEATSPAMLARDGIHNDTLKAGDKLLVVIRPLRDGRRGGSFVLLVDSAGKSYGAKPEDVGLRAEDLLP